MSEREMQEKLMREKATALEQRLKAAGVLSPMVKHFPRWEPPGWYWWSETGPFREGHMDEDGTLFYWPSKYECAPVLMDETRRKHG